MFVPVVTKDMQLFPGSRQQLPQRIKNVRSRAQSLEDNLNNGVVVNAQLVVNGANANAIAARSRIVPTAKQRNTQSVGSLPTSSSLAKSVPASRSPPKGNSARKPLDPIVEGVPLSASVPASFSAKPLLKKKRDNEASSPVEDKENPSSSCTTPSSNKSTPDLQDLRIRPSSSLSTASAPGLDKSGTSPPAAANSSSSSSSGKGIVKWITNTLKGKNGSSNSSKDKENGAKNQPEALANSEEMDNGKPWKSIGAQNDESKHS